MTSCALRCKKYKLTSKSQPLATINVNNSRFIIENKENVLKNGRDRHSAPVSRTSSLRSHPPSSQEQQHGMEVKWDFTSSESELSGGEDPNLNGGWRENSNGHHNSSEKKRGRQKMLSFSARDQVVEFPTGSLPITPQAASAVMKRIQSKSSFDWDFSDEEHYPTIKASPNRSPPTSNYGSNGGGTFGRSRRINFAAPPESQWTKPVSSSIEHKVARDNRDDNSLGVTPHIKPGDNLDELDSKAAVKSSPTTVNSNGKPPNIIISNEQEKLNQSLSSKLDPEILEEENKELLINWNNSPVNPKLQENNYKEEEIKNDDSEINIASMSDPGDDESIGRFSRTLSLTSLKRYTSKTSLISTYDFIKDKVAVAVPGSFKKRPDETKLRFVVAFFFMVIVLLICIANILYDQHKGQRRIFGNVKFDEHHGTISLYDGIGKTLIEGHIGVGIFDHKDHPNPCRNFETKPTEKCLEWHLKSRVTIKHEIYENGSVNCYNLLWESLNPSISPKDCFYFGPDHGHWYGGGESLKAAWPLEEGQINSSAFITGDEGQTNWGNSIKKYFTNSKGVILTIADNTPLFVSIDQEDHGLCLEAKFDNFAYYYHRFDLPTLNYSICTGGKNTSDLYGIKDGQGDMKKLHNYFLPKTFWHGHDTDVFQKLQTLVEKPIWQVPVKQAGNHESLKKYLDSSLHFKKSDSNENRGFLLLDHHWQKNMGDFKFDNVSFPNIEETLQMINQTGLKLVLTINPFISTQSENFESQKHLFVRERNSTAPLVPALTWFKDASSAGLLDITSNITVDWLKNQLKALKSLNEDAIMFYLDTGNTFHIPKYYEFRVPLASPDLFGDLFVKHCMSEVSVIGVSGASSKRPKAPAFLFLSPLESTWENLQSIIPNMLQLSVVGYPFVNPGAVGGVGHFKNRQEGNLKNETTENDQNIIELYKRWWQLNTFLPIVHFIRPPMSFPKNQIENLATKLKFIRETIVEPHMVNFTLDAMVSSMPVIRPLWMLDPDDHANLVIDDEFLIGNKILVAPILRLGQTKRNIYLPKINSEDAWFDWNGKMYTGDYWLNNTEVDIDTIPYFVRKKHNFNSRHQP